MVTVENISIFDLPSDVLLHSANCMHTMGAGIAKVIKQRYPEAYEADLATRKGDRKKLGTVSYAKVKENHRTKIDFIFNMYAQFDYGRGKTYTDYEAFERCLEETKIMANALKTLSIPWGVGCGYGGGKFEIIEEIIHRQFDKSRLHLRICKI